ncbi:endonuclease 8-like 1 isoform X2 [Corticium candelabrum]|uniref:endonuclease 8-like 1 isoform X2 n=1 Tax=Corticium candelabrum TaxID=121492 RepID=UPI002E26EED2|nr:endonuclease 8-like 1 isoform X2 [Corticium candelabrum]
MPELPELHMASSFVNAVGRQHVFTGKVCKSDVHRSEDLAFSCPRYTITSQVRGKEMSLILTPQSTSRQSVRLLFHMGMSGQFQFTKSDELHKHAHLTFFTLQKPVMALSFVDVRRFGGWQVKEGWGDDRGPDPVDEHKEFRKNIEENLEKSVFNKPICEVMMDQKYFNGIGNYLRAEILFRANVRPFECARSVLESLFGNSHDKEAPKQLCRKRATGKVQRRKRLHEAADCDFLQLCQAVPLEVMALATTPRDRTARLPDGLFPDPFVGTGYNSSNKELIAAFESWLKCYYKPGMKNLIDHSGRTVWFKGDPGPLAPKAQKSRGRRKRKLDNDQKIKTEVSKADSEEELKKLTKTAKRVRRK